MRRIIIKSTVCEVACGRTNRDDMDLIRSFNLRIF